MKLQGEDIVRFVKFGVTGLVVAGVNFALLAFFSRFLSPNAAFVSAYFPSIATHFLINKIWTFGCKRTDHGRQVGEYLGVVAINFSVNWVLFNGALWLVTDSPIIANLIAFPPTILISFLLMRRIVFFQKSSPQE